MIGIGIYRDETATVLNKAVNICLECVGIGWEEEKKYKNKSKPLENSIISHAGDQSPFDEFFQRENLQRQAEKYLRSRAELLLLSSGGRSVSDRFSSGRDRLLKIQVFLLYCRAADFYRRAAGTGGLRISLSIWMVSGTAP